MARKLVAFGNVAVGPIAIGNIAIGYVAIGLTVAIGPIAIGINALGFVLALGLNAVGAIDLALVNGLGGASFTLVNAIGGVAWSFVNHGAHPVVGLCVAAAELSGAFMIGAREEELVTEIDPSLDEQTVRLDAKRADERGLHLRNGTIVPFAPELDRSFVAWLAGQLEVPARVYARVQRLVTQTASEGYRAGQVDARLVVTEAEVKPLARWWAPLFRKSLVAGALVAAVVTVVAALLR